MKETKFTASDGASGDRFGWIVYIGGDTLLVGDPGKYKWGGGGGVCAHPCRRLITVQRNKAYPNKWNCPSILVLVVSIPVWRHGPH